MLDFLDGRKRLAFVPFAVFDRAGYSAKASQRLEREGLEVRGIVHSHPDHAAHFSAMDRQQATWRLGDDPPEPSFPGVSYLVISVYDGLG